MKKYYSFLALISLLFLSACSGGDETATVRISIVDSPGDFDKAVIDIQSVQLNASAAATESDNSWLTIPNENGPVNLLDYTDGNELTLNSAAFPAGKISQIRLVIGNNNSITVDGIKYNLINSSNQQGLILKVDEVLKEGNLYNLQIDFNLSKSVIAEGNGKYILKPVLRLIGVSDSGISGDVYPADENVAILILSDQDTVGTSYAISGFSEFEVLGVPAGAYTVVFDPGINSNYKSKTLNNILFTAGETNRIDPVNLDTK